MTEASSRSSDDEIRFGALALARGLGPFWQNYLGDGFLGFYLLGSLAHGGFNRRYSDIDVGLVSENGVDETAIEAMRSEAARLAPDLASKVSLFWTDRSFSVGRFPPLDRMDYLDNATPVIERERIVPARPGLDDVRYYLRGLPFENWRKATERFAALEVLEPAEHKPFIRAFLYPARFVYSWTTGRMDSNDTAVAFLRENAPDGLDVALIERALACRQAAEDPDGLFPDRKKLPDLVASCARLIPA